MRPITKIAVYCGILLLSVGGILFWLGGLEKNYQVDTFIDAPPKAVFSHLTDPTLIPNWMDGVVSIEPITSGRHEQGARSRIVYEHEGKKIVFRDEVIVTDQDSRLLVSSDCPMFRASSDYSLKAPVASEDKTNLRLIFQVQYKGFYRFMGPFMGGSVQKKLEDDIQRLKLEVERVHHGTSAGNSTMNKASTKAGKTGVKNDGDGGEPIKKSNDQASLKQPDQKK